MARRGVIVVLLFLGAAVVISLTTIILLYALVGREPAIPDRATLTMRIGGDLAEQAPADVVSYLSAARPPTVRSLVDALKKAKVDPRVHAILLQPTGFTTPYWGKIQEVRDAVIDFRSSGKPVYAYLEYAGDRDY